MLPISENMGAMFPRMVWDAGPWTPRGFMRSDKKAGPFKPEIAGCPNGLPGEIILVEPSEPEDLDDPRVLNLDKD